MLIVVEEGATHVLVLVWMVKSEGQEEQELIEVPEHVAQVTSHLPQ